MQSENTETLFIREIRFEQRWADDEINKVEDFSEYIKKKFIEWTQILTNLCDQKKYDDHALAVKEILELRNHLDKIFPKELVSISVDVFEIRQYTIKAEHFLTPQPFYPNCDVLKKHVQFSVYSDDKVTLRYFLESSPFYGLMQYVLGSSTVDYSKHRQIENYASNLPKYIDIKNVVIEDLTVGKNALITSERKT